MVNLMKKILFCLIFGVTGLASGFSQNLLYGIGNGINGGYGFGYFNLETCTFCLDMEVPISNYLFNDVVPLANGNVVAIESGGEVNIFNPPNPVPVSTTNITVAGSTSLSVSGAIIAPNGNVYIAGSFTNPNGDFFGSIWSFDPNTGTVVLLGSLPANTFYLADIFYWNGQLYAFAIVEDNPPESALLSLTIGPPLVATVVYSYPSVGCGAPTAVIPTGPFSGIYTAFLDPNCNGWELYEFDIDNNTVELGCSFLPNGFPYGLGAVPDGFPLPPANCTCLTDAGNIPTPNGVLCPSETFVFTNENEFLDPSDTKQYILFSDLADTLGSIVVLGNMPSFPFLSPLQTDVTYYAAVIAGNSVAGNVDLNDPCLNISNAISVVWKPLPTVNFTVATSQTCAGECKDIEVDFTGAPPFNLTYQTLSGGAQSQIFSGNSGILQICPPAGFLGNLVVSAVSLADANCTCE